MMFAAPRIPVNLHGPSLRILLRRLGALALAPRCCLCGAAGRDARLDLCEVCHALMPVNSTPARKLPPPFDAAIVPFTYAYPVKQFVRALKFGGERVYARVLGVLLAEAQQASGRPLPELLIPMPLHAGRYRSRGFNQAAEIARFAAGELQVRVGSGYLVRTVATREQSGLPLATRRSNVRGAFRACAPVNARHIALVDDVLTTGSTAAEAGHALKAAGVEHLELWAAARVLIGDKHIRA